MSISSLISSVTHTQEITDEARNITYRYLAVNLSRIIFSGIAEIFFILQIIQNLSPTQAGVIFSLQFALVSLLDYPTGGLADSIGHRSVLLIAHGLRAISFILISFANNFVMFILVIVLFSISISQESGALESWFDNNYKLTINNRDEGRIKYTAIKGRETSFRQTILAAVFILGGAISSLTGRGFLFVISAAGFGFVFILDYFVLKPTPQELETKRKKMTANLVEGLRFTIKSRSHAFLFLGFGLGQGASYVWYIFLLFQTYDAYSGSEDFYTALLRTIIFVIGIPLSVIATYVSKKMENTELWIVIVTIIGGSLFYISVFFLFQIFPPESTLVLRKYIYLIIVFTVFGGMWFPLMQILGNRYFLDFYPDKIRNSLFSFSSSLASFVAIPFQILIGYLISIYSLKVGILAVGIMGLIGITISGFGLFELKNEDNEDEDENQLDQGNELLE